MCSSDLEPGAASVRHGRERTGREVQNLEAGAVPSGQRDVATVGARNGRPEAGLAFDAGEETRTGAGEREGDEQHGAEASKVRAYGGRSIIRGSGEGSPQGGATAVGRLPLRLTSRR